jgi:hypothetical protein
LRSIALQEIDATVVVAHNLSGDTQSDTGTFLLGGEERDKDLLLAAHRDRFAIVPHLDNHLIVFSQLGCDADVLSLCLEGIFYQVDENL